MSFLPPKFRQSLYRGIFATFRSGRPVASSWRIPTKHIAVNVLCLMVVLAIVDNFAPNIQYALNQTTSRE